MSYKSDYGQTFILLLPSHNASQISVEVTCGKFSQCLANQYLSNDLCVQCPDGFHSSEGSTSISDCVECPDGTLLLHSSDEECTISESFEEVTDATGWRVWASEFDSISSYKWAIYELEFYDNFDCTGTPISSSEGTPIDSANAGSGPELAFDGKTSNGGWAGRKDSNGLYYLGLDFGTKSQKVNCVKLYQKGSYVKSIRVQAYKDGRWKNVWIEHNLTPGGSGTFDVISMNYEAIPSSPPTISESPSVEESLSPTTVPSYTSAPTLEYKEVTHLGKSCTSQFPSGKCEQCTGNCDSDSDCDGDMQCFKRDGGEDVPGCSWGVNSESLKNSAEGFCKLQNNASLLLLLVL